MADLKFEIDGKEYDVPDLTTLDLDEAEVLYTYTGFSIEDLFYDEDSDDAEVVRQRLRHPGIIKTLLHLSYRRANPDVKAARVTELIGKASYIDAVNVLSSVTEEVDAGPPDLSLETSGQPKPSDESLSLSSSSSEPQPESSGNGSTESSDAPAGDQPTTGTGGSDTSSLVSRVPTSGRFDRVI